MNSGRKRRKYDQCLGVEEDGVVKERAGSMSSGKKRRKYEQ